MADRIARRGASVRRPGDMRAHLDLEPNATPPSAREASGFDSDAHAYPVAAGAMVDAGDPRRQL